MRVTQRHHFRKNTGGGKGQGGGAKILFNPGSVPFLFALASLPFFRDTKILRNVV